MKVLHNFPKEVTDTFKAVGIIVNELDAQGGMETYYNLPQWFKEVNGQIFECPFDELPEQAKHIHISCRDYQRVFSSDEIKACALAMANWVGGFEGSVAPNEYFKQVLGIDISDTINT